MYVYVFAWMTNGRSVGARDGEEGGKVAGSLSRGGTRGR